jgi:pyruvate formate lyase activating enzyme
MTGRIHSIESCGTVDGPGIRLVVFMQGCPMRCLYCHNPDTWEIIAGKEITVREILVEYEKNKAFYTGGGITVTGGEPLLQIEFVTELFKAAKDKNIHTCLDTSGITFSKDKKEAFDRLTEVTDLVMLDIKHIDDDKHRKLTGCSNKAVLDFAEYLDSSGVQMWIRHVAVPGITIDNKDLYELGLFIGGLKNVKGLDVLPYHTMGIHKYKALGIKYPLEGIAAAEKQEAAEARKIIIRGIKDKRNNVST